jgi:hypothetical protein
VTAEERERLALEWADVGAIEAAAIEAIAGGAYGGQDGVPPWLLQAPSAAEPAPAPAS